MEKNRVPPNLQLLEPFCRAGTLHRGLVTFPLLIMFTSVIVLVHREVLFAKETINCAPNKPANRDYPQHTDSPIGCRNLDAEHTFEKIGKFVSLIERTHRNNELSQPNPEFPRWFSHSG